MDGDFVGFMVGFSLGPANENLLGIKEAVGTGVFPSISPSSSSSMLSASALSASLVMGRPLPPLLDVITDISTRHAAARIVDAVAAMRNLSVGWERNSPRKRLAIEK